MMEVFLRISVYHEIYQIQIDFEVITSSQPGQFEEESEIYSEELQDDPNDDTYQPSDSQSMSDLEVPELQTDSCSSSQADSQNVIWDEADPISTSKVIVFMSALLVLFRVCRVVGCGQPVDMKNITVKFRGGCVKVTCICNENHSMEVETCQQI